MSPLSRSACPVYRICGRGHRTYQEKKWEISANLKKLANDHKDTFIKYAGLDNDKIQSLTYLYEFDRYVQ